MEIETNINFSQFIQNHNKYFEKYDSINDVKVSSLSGYLYIFSASCYDANINKVFDICTDKFGKTKHPISQRLCNYKTEVNIKDIECIHCTLSEKRERLVKAYLKNKTSFKPVAGLEYFTGCRNLIKLLMLIIVYIEDNEIEIYESFYNTKNMKEVDKLFNKIETMIKEVKENDEFELNIDNNIHIEVTSSSFTCEHCKKNYSSVSSLNYHKKTNKSCLEIQQAHTSSINKFTCEFCKKEFTLKQTHTIHIQTCKEKRCKEENDTKELLLDYERQIKELQTQTKEYENKLQTQTKEYENKLQTQTKEYENKLQNQTKEYEIRLEVEQKIIKKLEKEIDEYKQLITRPTTTNNTVYNDNSKTNYNIQFNQLFEKLDILNDENIKKRIRNIKKEEIDAYDYTVVNNEVSTSLVNALKDLTFCSDKSRKIMVTKDENRIEKRIKLESFLNYCFKKAPEEIKQLLENIEDMVDDKVNNDLLTASQFHIFDDILIEMKKFLDDEDNGMKSGPFKSMNSIFIENCNHLNKTTHQN